MKQLLDYIPLTVFFIVYKLDERIINIGSFEYTLGGIFSATEVLVGSSILLYGSFYLINRKLERSQLIILVAVLVFCSFTLFFRDEAILKWKAPVVNWIFSVIFFASHFLNTKPAAQLMMGHAITLPDQVWNRLNMSWAFFFLFLGCANLYVAFTFHEYWVDFKVFGSLGFMFLFIVGQTFYMARYIEEEDDEAENKNTADQQ